jgi:CubicO group peptidase (beta-lactamase class C family)
MHADCGGKVGVGCGQNGRGRPRHDWIWVPGDLSPAQMLAAMRYLEPSEDIRSIFQYCNLGFLIASMVAERITGQSWTEFTRARLTDKLHMNVTFTVEDLAAATDAAMPYAMDGDTRVRSKLWPIRATAAGRHQHLDCELRELASPSPRQG